MGIEMRYGSADRLSHALEKILPWRVEYDDGSLRVLVCAFAPHGSGEIALPGHHLFMVCMKGSIEIVSEHALEGKSEPRRLAAGDYLCISGDVPVLTKSRDDGTSELIVIAIAMDTRSALP